MRKAPRQAPSRPHNMHVTAFEDVPYSREALDRVTRRCVGTPRGQPLSFRVWQARGDQHWRQDRGATRNCQVHYRRKLWSRSRLRIVMTVASVSHSRPSSHSRCQTKWSSIPRPSRTLPTPREIWNRTCSTKRTTLGALQSVDGGSSWETVNLDLPWHCRKTTWRRARAFRFLCFCDQKKVHLAGVSNSSGETCHHARQCEKYDHMSTSSQARTLDVEGDLTAAPDQEMGITLAHVCCFGLSSVRITCFCSHVLI